MFPTYAIDLLLTCTRSPNFKLICYPSENVSINVKTEKLTGYFLGMPFFGWVLVACDDWVGWDCIGLLDALISSFLGLPIFFGICYICIKDKLSFLQLKPQLVSSLCSSSYYAQLAHKFHISDIVDEIFS